MDDDDEGLDGMVPAFHRLSRSFALTRKTTGENGHRRVFRRYPLFCRADLPSAGRHLYARGFEGLLGAQNLVPLEGKTAQMARRSPRAQDRLPLERGFARYTGGSLNLRVKLD